MIHSVLERIWVKGSYLSQWLPQGERGPPKESKSLWIEIFHGGKNFLKFFSDKQTFHPVVVIGLGNNLLFKSVLGHCDVQGDSMNLTLG